MNELNLNDKQKALILGMVMAINDDKLHFIGIVDRDENQQNLINNAKGIDKNAFSKFVGPTQFNKSNTQSVSMIHYDQQPNPQQFTPHTPFTVPRGLFMWHEVVGHALSYAAFWDVFKVTENVLGPDGRQIDQAKLSAAEARARAKQTALNQLQSVQVYNLWLKALNIHHHEDGGEWHNQDANGKQGDAYDKELRNQIPDFLKTKIK